ncbi:MAG TPA: FAD-dependent oxidoreductase [Arenicellales bacterium]|nr:FAD-dependent oxidoreductase [Arenicellales bacterium]
MPESRKLSGRFDLAVIGGGVHGAAAALEATRLGWKVLLVERSDFCSGTSANSLRIIHGGLRYLQSASIRRSRESAREQHRLLESAPQMVRPLDCLMGTDASLARGRAAMAIGLWFYDRIVCLGLSDRTPGRLLPAAEAGRLAGVDVFRHCTGAAQWRDARVVDSERLVLAYLLTAEREGACILNHTAVVDVSPGTPATLEIRDAFSGETRTVQADQVIDTAAFIEPHRYWSRAVNLVLDKRVSDYALGLKLGGADREAGRLFFATPLGGRTAVGTWYFPDRADSPEQLAPAELDRCLSDVRELLPDLDLRDSDVSRVHLGRLPVRDPSDPLSLLDKPVIRSLSRDGRIVGVTGVKFTTAHPTAVKALRKAGLASGREPRQTIPWYGTGLPLDTIERRVRNRLAEAGQAALSDIVARRLSRQYGSAAAAIAKLAVEIPRGCERIPECDGLRAEIDYCIDNEHCRTLSDFLVRRSGIGSLARPPAAAVEYCAGVMADRFGWDAGRVAAEIDHLTASFRHC